ncbi:glycosyltransferase family 2 protein [uncultured Ramlibacter sp.]|uniref:glycosyltransferase n=1 Tax=uncultured Ramlibacter sp. TaxID=260755 RepID=UPI0026358C47|nr:glycosyltransferase family 2 protein [uncultured Ramlibacter sp.]
MDEQLVLAAVVNWNGWRDTLICAQSLRAMSGPPFHLLLCDNGSSDESYDHLCEWARQALSGAPETQLDFEGAGSVLAIESDPGAASIFRGVYVMRLPRNYGYAGAINRCISWGRERLDPDCFWLLNNDVWLEPAALKHLLAATTSASDIGLCGSVLLEWDDPHQIQAVGGLLRRVVATGSHLKQVPTGVPADQNVFFDIDYPVGASMLATRGYLQAVGLMDEDYFLYYEEVDWAERGRACGFRPAVALHSRLRHKEGASTGSVGGIRHKSLLSEYYGVVNRLRFTRKFSPRLVPVVWVSLFLVVLDRLVHHEWRRAGLVLRLMFLPRSVPRPGAPQPGAARLIT